MKKDHDIKMPYGKFKGIELWRIPSGYLKWVAENFDNDIICKAADEEWQYREHYKEHFNEVLEKK